MRDPRDVKRILDLEYELAEYKRQLAEQMLINDLLKELHESMTAARALKKLRSSVVGLTRSPTLDRMPKRVQSDAKISCMKDPKALETIWWQ